MKISFFVIIAFLGISLFLFLTFTYVGKNDTGIKNMFTQSLGGNQDDGIVFYNGLKEDRRALFGDDILRSFIFIAVAFILLYGYLKGKIKLWISLWSIIILISIDVLWESKMYFSGINFVDPEAASNSSFKASSINLEILRDSSNPRVLNLAAPSGPFNEAITSYFHRSVGGYHPAKLGIYDKLISTHINKQPINMAVLDMLNTKYIIYPASKDNKEYLKVNSGALGNSWFVKKIHYVKDLDEELNSLDNFSPVDSCFIEEKHKKEIAIDNLYDTASFIHLLVNDNDEIRYRTSSKYNQFGIFSEIFYDRGWKAYIDNKETKIFQSNYVLRGLVIPAGNHIIKFEFKPDSYYKSNVFAIFGSFTVWVLLIIAFLDSFYKSPVIKKDL